MQSTAQHRTKPHRPVPHTWPRAREAARELAAARLRERADALPAVEVSLAAALGASLAEDLTARVGTPPYDAAAMDGYAVAGEGPWKVVGRVLAGRDRAADTLIAGQAVEIATGARVPPGTAAVLPYEAADVDADVVTGSIAAGRHVRWYGEETAPGDVVAPAGTVVTPAVLGLAAGSAHDTLRVRRPRAVALITGDELTGSGVPESGTVRDAIGPMLPGIVAWAGGTLAESHYISDGFDAMVSGLSRAASRPDVETVVVCGASSAGPADHLRGALAELGARVVVDGVACRPGHPQVLARMADGTVVVGLPGNPTAALVASVTLLVPILATLAGRFDPTVTDRRLPVSGEARPHSTDTRIIGVHVHDRRVVPVTHDRPANLRGVAAADGLAVIPPDWEGGEVELLRLPH